jgi:hypothetical protein
MAGVGSNAGPGALTGAAVDYGAMPTLAATPCSVGHVWLCYTMLCVLCHTLAALHAHQMAPLMLHVCGGSNAEMLMAILHLSLAMLA